MLWEKIYEQPIMLDVHLLNTEARTKGLILLLRMFHKFPYCSKDNT
jgi:hypothetical protein